MIHSSDPLPYTHTIRSLFRAHRELKLGLPWVVKNTRLTMEEADLLLCLYGVNEPGQDTLARDGHGFVTCHELADTLIQNPSLLSRRIIRLAKHSPPLVEVAKGDAAVGHHWNSKRVRITSDGGKEIAGVWERYQVLAASLLQGIPEPDRVTHQQINRDIRRRIRAGRACLETFLADKFAQIATLPSPHQDVGPDQRKLPV